MWLGLAIALAVVINILATLLLLASKESRGRKWFYAFAIWLIPLLGPLLVFIGISPGPVNPYSICQSHVPWSTGDGGGSDNSDG